MLIAKRLPTARSAADRAVGVSDLFRRDPRRAIQEDAIVCLVCGKALRQLTNTHLAAHATDPAEYKERFGYNRGRPLMCLSLQRLYSERAVRSRLASYIRQRPILAEPELRRRGGHRSMALEELLTRREVRQRASRLRIGRLHILQDEIA